MSIILMVQLTLGDSNTTEERFSYSIRSYCGNHENLRILLHHTQKLLSTSR